jgi:muramidase (phage lysozyme)
MNRKTLRLCGIGLTGFLVTHQAVSHLPISQHLHIESVNAASFVTPSQAPSQTLPQAQTTSGQVPQWVKDAATNSHFSKEDNERIYRKLQITPEWMVLRALIRVIGRMEGTYNPAKPDQIPYQVLFGFRISTDYSKHPDICTEIGAWGEWADDCSTAAGLGQWITSTWDGVQKRWKDAPWYSDGEFSPRNQDLATVRHLAELGIYDKMIAGIRVSGDQVVLDEATYKLVVDKYLSRTWASFPCMTGMKYKNKGRCDGTSFYGQGGKSYATAWRYIQEELAKENQGEWIKQNELQSK